MLSKIEELTQDKADLSPQWENSTKQTNEEGRSFIGRYFSICNGG